MKPPTSDLPSPNKLRGGYYTDCRVAAWLCRWAIRSKADQVLEPSSGDGVFLEAAAKRLLALGAGPRSALAQLRGIEITAEEAQKGKFRLERLLGHRPNGQVACADFFAWRDQAGVRFDSVVGNPPFIRYQCFPEPSRTRAMALMCSFGLRPNRLTNIWVPFVVGGAGLLNEGGRLAMVLPAELLQVSYAAQLRKFLADHFGRIHLFTCNHLFFEGAEQEVVLLLADGYARRAAANECLIEMIQADSVDEIVQSAPDHQAPEEYSAVQHSTEKWLKYFLKPKEIGFMRSLKGLKSVASLGEHAEVDIGVVTGRNDFFVVSQEQVEEYQLARYAVPLVGRSSQLRGAVIEQEEWRSLARGGQRAYLLVFGGPGEPPLNAGAKRYIRWGEEAGVSKGYKCSIRDPWYAVPSVWVPECFFFRQIYDFPRAVVNRAGAVSTDTIHRMRCRGLSASVAAALYTHLTAASAEIEGRSYGGGVLELEPTEAERLLLPKRLDGAMPIDDVDRLVRSGRLAEVLEHNDRSVLQERLGLSRGDCAMLKGVWSRMRDRRMARRR